MKIAIIGDQHHGVRNDNQLFLLENQKFFKDIFFPYVDANHISKVVHLGDVVDRRKYINYNTASFLRKDVFDELNIRSLDCHFIAGNHDVMFRTNNNINALRELIQDRYPSFHIYDNYAEEVMLGKTNVLFIPWICDDNITESLKIINKTSAKIAMGHLEIAGFEMHKGSVVSHGQDRNIFSKFDAVYSGHFHHKSTDGHIFYLGSIAEFTWSDYNDDKGFHIFDTETREIEFIRNPNKVHHRLIYDELDTNFSIDNINYSIYNNRIVKIVVKEKNNLYLFDRFMNNLEKQNPYDIQIVEDRLNLNIDDEETISEVESTLDICYSYIDKIDSKNKYRDKVKNMLSSLYEEANSL